MDVEMPFTMPFPVTRSLVKAHRVRKRNLEQIVITRSYLLEDIGKLILGFIGEFRQRVQMGLAHNHYLKRPNRPEWNDGLKPLVGTNQAFLKLQLQFQVITEQATLFIVVIVGLRGLFL